MADKSANEVCNRKSKCRFSLKPPHLSIVPVDTNNDIKIGMGRKKTGLKVAGLAVVVSLLAAYGTGNTQAQEANITPKLDCYGSNQIRKGESGPYTLIHGRY